MFGRNSSEELLKKIMKLDNVEFLGVCKILGVKLYDVGAEAKTNSEDEKLEKPDIEPRSFTDIWCDLCDKVYGLSRKRRKNLNRLISAALEKED